MPNSIANNSESNVITLGHNVEILGNIRGEGNVIEIGDTRRPTTLLLSINGNNNRVKIGHQGLFNNLRIDIGSKRWLASEVIVNIGDYFSIASKGHFIFPNSGNTINIGNNCMFSNNIIFRGGEYPHLIFSDDTQKYLDLSDGIFIEDRVWIGEGAYITKAVTIPSGCVVGARSVVTKRFHTNNAVLAGNPARIVKEGVRWVTNENALSEYPELERDFRQSKVDVINQKYRLK